MKLPALPANDKAEAFSITLAFGDRQRRNAFMLMHALIRGDLPPEQCGCASIEAGCRLIVEQTLADIASATKAFLKLYPDARRR
jgi:hypothetical protein